MTNGRLYHRSVKIFIEKDGVEWAMEPLGMQYRFPVHVKAILLNQAMKRNKVANISTAVVGGGSSFTDIMQNLLVYMQAMEEHYRIRYVTARRMHILQDRFHSTFLAANPGLSTYATWGLFR